MSILTHKAALAVVAAVACAIAVPRFAPGQGVPATGVKFQVRGPAERLEMTVNTSRVVEFPFDVPRLMVNNTDLVRAVPISPRSIQLSALKSGVTQLNVFDGDNNVTTVDVIIMGDVKELELTLQSLFPEASVRVRPLNSSLYISGFVPKADMVASITRVAQDFFPNIINDMTVGGQHKILLHVKVMEVSRTKLRNLGFDWAQLSSGISQSVSGVLPVVGQGQAVTALGTPGSANLRFGVVGTSNFFGFLEALRQNELARLMAEPTLVTLDGRPAQFNVGGQVPIPLQQALGVTTVQYRQFGTQIDFVPIVLGNGMVRLEVRPDVTEIDPSLRDAVTGVPGFRQRYADTAVELKAGQTLAIAGLVFTREDVINRGIPWLADLPWVGVPFRRVSALRNDVELLIFVTPEFCEAMDPSEVPPCAPGQLTTTPTDVELYYRGYLEVPKNCLNGNCGPGGAPGPFGPGPYGPMYEQLPSPQPAAPAGQPGMPPSSARPNSAKAMPLNTASSAAPRRANATGIGATGTGATARSVSTTRINEPSPSPSSPYYSSGKPQNSGGPAPTLIGPLGYDDLK